MSWKAKLKPCVPPILHAAARNVMAWFFYGQYRRSIAKNSRLRDTKSGARVYILGNGPSLNNFEVDTILDDDVITMNFFHLHPRVHQFKIVAHCFGESSRLKSFLHPKEMMEGVVAENYWFNVDARHYCERHYADKSIHYYQPGIDHTFNFKHSADLAYPALGYQSTSQMAIMIAMHMGYSEIYLLGFDHDWLCTRGISKHFYLEGTDETKGMEADFSGFTYLEMINMSKRLFEIYEEIARLARKQGTKIVNLSEPSYLDVFPASGARR